MLISLIFLESLSIYTCIKILLMLSFHFVDLNLVPSSKDEEKDELESSVTLRNLQDKSETSLNPKNSNELQDVTLCCVAGAVKPVKPNQIEKTVIE